MHSISNIPRRVVTGLKDGCSIIVEDSTNTNVAEEIPGLVVSDIWATRTVPVDLEENYQIENTLLPVTPPNGSYFRYVSIPPDAALAKHLEINIKPGLPHPLMHKTETLDYIVILAGEIYLILDKEETLLKAGDIVIQRGTNHAWSNRSNQPCIQLAILLGAK